MKNENYTVVEALLEQAEKNPEKLFAALKEQQYSYAMMKKCMQGGAAVLAKQYGIKKGDFIMLSAPSSPVYLAAYLAIQYLGAVSIPVDKSAKAESLSPLIDFIKPELFISDMRFEDCTVKKISLKEFCTQAAEYAGEYPEYERPEMNSLCEMLFTTGTTGLPKGGMLSLENVYASSVNTIVGTEMTKDDVILLPLPLNHSVGMREIRACIFLGATLVLQNGFTFANALEKNINDYKCTALVSVPASIELVMRQMQEHFQGIIGKLRYIEIGAGSLSTNMKKKLSALLPDTRLINTWGSTETGGAIFLPVTDRPDKLNSLGKPIDGVTLKIIDEEGNDITETARNIDTAGRMVLQGKMQMLGYFKRPEENEKTLVDGWLRTNDLVYTDDEGFVYMLGRADDIINVGGEKVSPVEVENIAGEAPGIRECACIGIPDPKDILGFVPVLFVVPESRENTASFDEPALVKYLSVHMEKYKLPHYYMQLEELPRNRMKKLDRKALKTIWQEQELNGNGK